MALFLALQLVLAPGRLAAQAAAESYDELIRRAVSDYESGNWNEAKAYFARAHALQPSARTLRGLGLASHELRHYADAIFYLQAARESTVQQLTEALRAEIDGVIAEARTFIAHLRVEAKPAGAVLKIDAAEARVAADGRLMLDPGVQELSVEAPGYLPATRKVHARSGDELSLAVELVPLAAPELAPAPPPFVPAEQQPEPVPASSSGSIAPWLWIGAGGAVTVTGVVLLALGLADVAEVEDAEPGSRWGDVEDANDRAPVLSGAGIACIAVGAAAVGVGVVWKLSEAPEERPAAQLALTPLGARLQGAF